MLNQNQEMMNKVYELAQKAFDRGEIPVGCIIVKDSQIISEGYNLRQSSHRISDHSEIIALNDAGIFLERWNLSDCEMYLSLEPCLMCYSAILQSRISKVYIGAKQLDFKKSTYRHYVDENDLFDTSLMQPRFSEIMNEFFIKLREGEKC